MTTPITYSRISYEVQAMHLTTETIDQVAVWTGGKVVQTNNTSPTFLLFPNIDEPRGVVEAQPGDYVVKGTDGRFTRVKAETFLRDFEVKVTEVQQ